MSAIDYTHKYQVLKGKLLVHLNFTKDSEETTLTMKNLENILYSNPISHEAEFIFIDSTPSIKITPIKPIDEDLLKGISTTGEIMAATAEVLASGGAALGIAAIFLQLPIAGAIIRFVLVFKILNRLRLINVNTGGLLGSFLNTIYNLFEYGNDPKTSSLAIYGAKTRGKLSTYNILVTPFLDASHLYYLYFVR